MNTVSLQTRLPFAHDALAAFCRRWHIVELAVFGSVLRDDFGPASDVDVLITVKPGVQRSLDDALAMENELAALFGRPVDVVNRKTIERSRNYIRRRSILESSQVIYVA